MTIWQAFGLGVLCGFALVVALGVFLQKWALGDERTDVMSDELRDAVIKKLDETDGVE